MGTFTDFKGCMRMCPTLLLTMVMKFLITKHAVRTQLFINRSAIEYPSKDHHVLKRKHKCTLERWVMMLLRGTRPGTQRQLGDMSLHQAGCEPGPEQNFLERSEGGRGMCVCGCVCVCWWRVGQGCVSSLR